MTLTIRNSEVAKICFILPQVLDFLNMKVFVDTDSDIRLSRRLNRDIRHRGRDLASVLEQVQGNSGVRVPRLG